MATRFYLPGFYAAEHELAHFIKRLNSSSCQKIEPEYGDLAADQPKAVDLACTKPLSILRGLPGTGKTTTLRKIVESYDNAGMKGIILCPTGKASKRSDEVVNDPSRPALKNPPVCSTVHRGLQWRPFPEGFTKNFHDPLDYDYAIMDEGSMAGLMTGTAFFSAIDPKKTRVVICGDPNQLPSVEPGNVMHDMIMSGVIPETNLTKLFRQGEESGIAYNASMILKGEKLSRKDPRTGESFTDFYCLMRNKPEESFESIMEYACDKIPEKRGFDPVDDIQVLSPGKKSAVGVNILNKSLRDRLNPNGKNTDFGFRMNDKVINRTNNFDLDIVNGDVGRIVDSGKKGLTVNFSGRGEVELTGESISALRLAYAFTVHSSQGSEFKVCILPIHTSHYQLLYRNMFYTGITRASKLTVCFGDPKAIMKAINTSVVDKRITGLQRLLRAA